MRAVAGFILFISTSAAPAQVDSITLHFTAHSTVVFSDYGDTLSGSVVTRTVNASPEALRLVVTTANLRYAVRIMPRPSPSNYSDPEYWINPFYKGRYAYPRAVYVRAEDTTGSWTSLREPPRYVPPPMNFIKISPAAPFSVTDPRLELAYERTLTKSISVQARAALLTNGGIDLSKSTLQGYSAGVEGRYYFYRHQYDNMFFACGGGMLHRVFYDSVSYSRDKLVDSTYHLYTALVRIERNTWEVWPKVGMQLHLLKRLSMEIGIALGLRYREVAHTGKHHDDDLEISPRHPNVIYSFYREGKYFSAALPITAMIAWAF